MEFVVSALSGAVGETCKTDEMKILVCRGDKRMCEENLGWRRKDQGG
jgi:predicted Fe-S protein YdhL (DUF1289 family)